MEKLTVGRNVKNDVVLEDSTISNFHLEVEFVTYDHYLISDLNSSNGTFINEIEINKSSLRKTDDLRLGSAVIDTNNLFDQINAIVKKNKTDFRKEFISLIRLFEQYQGKKNSIVKTPLLPTMLRLGFGVAIILILIAFPDLIPERARIPLMMAVGLVSVLSNVLGNSHVKRSEKLDLLRLEFEDRLVCPKCNMKLINQNVTYWKGKNSCTNERCDAIFQ